MSMVSGPGTVLTNYFHLYNYERPYQSLGYLTPADVHFAIGDQFCDLSLHLILTGLWS